MTIYNPKKLFVVAYDSQIHMLTNDKEQAEQECKKQKKEWSALDWKVYVIEKYPFEMWSDGYSEMEMNYAERD